MKRCVLLILPFVLPTGLAISGSHSHYFFTTLTYNLPSDFPSYYTTRAIDDITVFRYDSDNGVIERRVPWFKGVHGSLLDLSDFQYSFHSGMETTLHDIMNYLNHTEGYHTLQILDGCILHANGTGSEIWSYHYNGKPLTFFNWEIGKWTAELLEYEDLVKDVFGNETISEEEKKDLMDYCIPHIKELLSLGKCTFDRKEAPVVKVTPILVDHGTLRVHCRAYGHYPKDISIMWYKNGQQISEEMMERTTLPLLDLTYLTSLSINVTSMVNDLYTCKVNHSSILQEFSQDWRISGDFGDLSSAPSGLSIGAVIAICVAIVFFTVIIVFGSVFFAKSRKPGEILS